MNYVRVSVQLGECCLIETIYGFLITIDIPYLNWFDILIYWILQLPGWTIVAEAIREIEKGLINQNL